jgi:hypothetical protein
MLLGSCFAPISTAADCKVNAPDIAEYYSGDCKNGLADGFGAAKGKDEYKGEFFDGKPNGKGTYIWGNGSRYDGNFAIGELDGTGVFLWINGSHYEGNYFRGKRHGFGTMTTPRNAYVASEHSGKGQWIGDNFVEQGLYENDVFLVRGKNEIEASENKLKLDEKELEKMVQERKAREKQAARDKPAQERAAAAEAKRREASERYDREHACDRLYTGKPVKFTQGEQCSGGGYFGGPRHCDTPWFDAEIVGVSKSNGLATARAQGKLFEKTCSEFK